MHEGNFTRQIVESILTELKKSPMGHARRVHIRVGEMLHLNTESVQAHFSAAIKGTPLESAQLELEEVPVQLKCRVCKKEWTPEDHHFLFCESCQKSEVEVTSGNQVVIETIDLEV